MKRGTLRVLLIGLVSGACYLGMCLFSCGPTNPPAKNPNLADFIITAPGWAAPADSNTYWIYNDTIHDPVLTHKIEHFVDGGDWNYIQDSTTIAGKTVTTLDSGFRQTIYRSDLTDITTGEVFVLDYGTAAEARTVFQRIYPIYMSAREFKIGSFDTSAVIGGLSSSSVWTFAHFGRYYIEFHMFPPSGSTTVTSDSLVHMTNVFFQKYQALVK
jgi:hypothetical protein